MSDNHLFVVFFLHVSSVRWAASYYFNTSGRDINYNGHLWRGVDGNIVDISGIEESAGPPEETTRLVVRLPDGLDLSTAADDPRAAPADLYAVAVTDAAGGGVEYVQFKHLQGYLSQGRLSGNEYAVNIVNWRADADRGEIEYWEPNAWRRNHNGDAGFDQVRELAAGQLKLKFPRFD